MSIGQQHLHARKRLFQNLEPFPSRNFFKRGLDYLMYGVGTIAPLALVPQIVHVYQTRDVSSLSLPTWSLLIGYNFLWAVYGLVHHEKQIFIANSLMTVCNVTIVVAILRF